MLGRPFGIGGELFRYDYIGRGLHYSGFINRNLPLFVWYDEDAVLFGWYRLKALVLGWHKRIPYFLSDGSWRRYYLNGTGCRLYCSSDIATILYIFMWYVESRNDISDHIFSNCFNAALIRWNEYFWCLYPLFYFLLSEKKRTFLFFCNHSFYSFISRVDFILFYFPTFHIFKKTKLTTFEYLWNFLFVSNLRVWVVGEGNIVVIHI